jgi:hypothetical protein
MWVPAQPRGVVPGAGERGDAVADARAVDAVVGGGGLCGGHLGARGAAEPKPQSAAVQLPGGVPRCVAWI